MTDLAAGEALFRLEPRFEWAAAAMGDLPPVGPPEVCFAGRSNVGKSSLINALVRRKGLARASQEPGRTRQLIFFPLADADGRDHVRLVDLPGYGFAKASKGDIAAWTGMTRDYLRGRTALKRVFLLIDSRHGLKPSDGEIMDALDQAAMNYQIVLTKADKLKPPGVIRMVDDTTLAVKRRPACHPVVLAVSSETGLGMSELRAQIAELAGYAAPSS